MPDPETIQRLAELIVRFGANVQPGQIVTINSEPGKEDLARAVADVAYQEQARFVDLDVFDVYLKRSRVLHADEATLDFVPPWYGERMRALGEHRCARITLSGVAAPHALEGLDPARVGRDILPATREGMELLNARSTNWTVSPSPTKEWAALVHPRADGEQALELLWEQIARVCRLDEADPVAAGVDLPAPLGPTRPIRSPRGPAASTRSRRQPRSSASVDSRRSTSRDRAPTSRSGCCRGGTGAAPASRR